MATIQLVKDDTRPPLEFTILQDGSPVNLTGCAVKFYMKNASTGSVVVNGTACAITDASNGKCQYAWGASDLATAGTYTGECEVIFGDARIQTGYDAFTLIVRADLA